jgi:bifunctional ADP-heptose synthase (sugar kinase/adenylyltransferase)
VPRKTRTVRNTEAVVRIASRVAELAREHGLDPLKVTRETDGTTTFAHESISVHLFETDRELYVRGPGSARAAQIDPDAESTGHLSQAAVGGAAETIVGFLRAGFPAS